MFAVVTASEAAVTKAPVVQVRWRRPFRVHRVASCLQSLGQIRYALAGDRHIAFQVLSDGPLDLVLINESVLPIEALGHHPMVASYLERFAGWGRLVVFDRTGVGLSDAVPATGFGLDDWVDDVDAVLAAIGGSAVTLVSSGPSAGLIALRYALRHPEGTAALCLYDAITPVPVVP